MRDRLTELGDRATVALITFTDPDRATAYSASHELPFPVLIDKERTSYRAFGLGRGTVRRVWGWRAAHRYIEIIRKSGISGWTRPTEDTLQLGGDFIIGPDGTLAYGFWGEGPDDRPDIDELIEAVGRTQ